MLKKILKQTKYFSEYIIVRIFLFIFDIIGIKNASNFGSFLARKIGKHLSVNNLARENIQKSNLKKTPVEIEKMLVEIWDNIGRNFAETSYLRKISTNKLMKFVEISKESEKNIKDTVKLNKGGIFFSAHIGNWEIVPKIPLYYKLHTNVLYQSIKNPFLDKFLTKTRSPNQDITMIAKGVKGNKKIIEVMKKKSYLGILSDLHLTNGETINFLGRKAATLTTIAKLSLKYNTPIIPIHCQRIGKEFKFKITIEKAIDFKNPVHKVSVVELTTKINEIIEEWICKNPSQWFWVHNRWKQ